jgi:hypothetical protein
MGADVVNDPGLPGVVRVRKRPVEVDAIRYDPPNNCEQVWKFLGWPWPQPDPTFPSYHDDQDCSPTLPLFIDTLEGLMEAQPGDWIICGVKGEFYPCKPDIFEMTYEHSDDVQTVES